MLIWIDGDACPKLIKDILFRAAIRTQTQLVIVANHYTNPPPSPLIKMQLVNAGFDAADTYIVNYMQAGDLVITADIPLADLVVTKGGYALNPRGEMYTTNNIKHFLALRNLNESMRSCSVIKGGPAKLSAKEVQLFANNLDKFLAR